MLTALLRYQQQKYLEKIWNYGKYSEIYNKMLFTPTADESKSLNQSDEPCIIISASRNVRSWKNKTSFKT